MAKLTIFIFLTVLASVYNQCTIPKAQKFFKRSIYEFTVKLAGQMSQYESTFIISGLSPWSLLSTISLGATEDTLAEIARVLQMHPNKCYNEKYNQIARKLMTITNETMLERSSAIFVNNALEVSADFISDAAKAGICNIEVLPFTDAIATAAYVNNLTSKATHETIEGIVSAKDIEGASIVMIDALNFKGTWKIQFPKSKTKLEAFYDDKGILVGHVNLMFVNGIFNVTSVKQIQARVLEMPYGEDNRFSMLFFLPNTDVTINNLIDNLSNISIQTIFALFKRNQPKNVAVQIPRFKLITDVYLKELLMDMGLKKMFRRFEAQFDALASNPDLYVSNLIHTADIEITEGGTMASAVSEVEFESRMRPDQFIANKPFVFMVLDRESEIPLFTGAYSTPILYQRSG